MENAALGAILLAPFSLAHAADPTATEAAISDVFMFKQVTGGMSIYKWQRHDIYARVAGQKPKYIGTTEEGPPKGVGFVGDAAEGLRQISRAVSADGRTIVFRHAAWRAPREGKKLEGGVYRYVHGGELELLYRDPEVASIHSLWRKVPPPDLFPFQRKSGYRSEGLWRAVSATTGEQFPLVLAQGGALHAAAYEGRTADCKLMAEKGADVGASTYFGFTPLDLAIIRGHEDTAIEMLALGANSTASQGYPPLHRAVMLGRMRVVQAMLDRGVDVNGLDDAGQTPLHVAASLRTRVLGEFDEATETSQSILAKNITTALIRLLLDRGADPAIRDKGGATSLEKMHVSAPPEARQLLVQRSE